MSVAYGWAEHVGELELWVRATSEEEVFAEALRAVAEVLGGDDAGESQRRAVTVAGEERAVLLAGWLDELAFLAETEGFVPGAIESLQLSPNGVSATVSGHAGSPPHLIKAVTYHRLAFDNADGEWRANAVLDV